MPIGQFAKRNLDGALDPVRKAGLIIMPRVSLGVPDYAPAVAGAAARNCVRYRRV